MSGGLLIVMYPDMALRFGEFRGTTNTACTRLFLRPTRYARGNWDPEEAEHNNPPISSIDLQWDVEIYAHYGPGIRWRGSASKWCLDTTSPYRMEDFNGAEILPDAEDVASGYWEWVPLVWPMIFPEEEFRA